MYSGRATRTVVPPSAPCSTVRFPESVRARSAITSKLARRRSPGASSATIASTPPPSAANLDPRRWPASHRLRDRLADDLVERRARLRRQRLARVDVHVDLHPVREPERLRECFHRGGEALVAEHDRLEVEREIAERADRVALPCERAVEDPGGLLEPPLSDGVDRRVEHERDPRHRLDRAVVQLVREPPALLLLRGDQLVREPRPFELARLGLGPKPCVLAGPRSHVGEHGRPHEVAPPERPVAFEPQQRDLLVAAAKRDDHDLAVRVRRYLARGEHRRARLEEPLRLAARLLQHALGVECRGDCADRLEERLEEARLCGEVLLDQLVPPPLGDDQVQRERRRREQRRHELRERQRVEVAERGEHGRGRRQRNRDDQHADAQSVAAAPSR